MKINKHYTFEHVSEFPLHGRCVSLIVGKRCPQVPLAISTPGKSNSENLIFRHFLADILSTFPFHGPPALQLPWDQALPPNLLRGRLVYSLGVVDSSHEVNGPCN